MPREFRTVTNVSPCCQAGVLKALGQVVVKLKAGKTTRLISRFVSDATEVLSVVVEDDVLESDDELSQLIKRTMDEIGYKCEAITRLDLEKKQTANLLPSIELKQLNILSQNHPKITDPVNKIKLPWVKGFLTTLLGLIMLVMPLLGLPLPSFWVIAIVSTLLTSYAGKETFINAIKQGSQGKFGMDFLFALSTVVSLIVSLLAVVIPVLPMQFESALLIFGFKHIGKAIEDAARKEVIKGTSFRARAPTQIEQVKGPDLIVKELIPGQIIRVRQGRVIPVDGLIKSDQLRICDPLLKGHMRSFEPMDSKGKPDRQRKAGMVVPQDIDYIDLEVTATEERSRLSIMDAVKNRVDESKLKAPRAIQAKQNLGYFVPLVMVLALGFGGAVGLIFDPLLGVNFALSMLVSACPCIFGLIVPFAVLVGISKAAEQGANYRNGQSLEKCSKVTDVVFDVHGTLTKGTPRVSKFITIGNVEDSKERKRLSKKQLLQYCYALEEGIDHHCALAIRAHAKASSSTDTVEFKKIEKNRCGVRGMLNGQWLTLGNETMMEECKAACQFILQQEKRALEQIIFIAHGAELVGYFIIKDDLKEGAAATVDALKRAGKTIHICTGESKAVAEAYARQFNIKLENVAANCKPDEKSHPESKQLSKQAYIKLLQAQGKTVAMVGDGPNDATAVTESDVGVTVSSALCDIATEESSGIVISQPTLLPLVAAFQVAEYTVKHINKILKVNIAYNVLAMSFPFVLWMTTGISLSPGFCALFMVIQAAGLLASTLCFQSTAVPGIEMREEFKGGPHKLMPTLSTPRPVLRSAKSFPNLKEARMLEVKASRIATTFHSTTRRMSLPAGKDNPCIVRMGR
jgi:P-type Cu2+ transporter